MSTGSKSTVSGSVFRALALLEFVLGADTPPTSRELAERFSIPTSSLAALLSALRGNGYLVSDGGSIRPGTRLMALGQLAGRHEVVVNIRRALRLLVDRTGETAFYSIEVPGAGAGLGSVLPVEQVESPDEIRYVGILGRPTPLLRSMAGRAILAFSERDADVEATLTREGRVDAVDEILAELREIRRVGLAFATTPTSAAIGTMTVAAPVFHDHSVVGALSIAGPGERMKARRDELPAIFQEAQEVINQRDLPVDRPRRSTRAIRWHSATSGLTVEDE